MRGSRNTVMEKEFGWSCESVKLKSRPPVFTDDSLSPKDQKPPAREVARIAVGNVLRNAYLTDLRHACAHVGAEYNPYELLGSGMENDLTAGARIAMQRETQSLMRLFGSAGKA